MGFRVDNNQIWLTRGDTLKCTIGLVNKATGEPYDLAQGDSVRFALKHSRMNASKTAYDDKSPLLTKTIPVSTMALVLDPEDTSGLDFGNYVYDVQVTFADESVDTVIEPTPFYLTAEVE